MLHSRQDQNAAAGIAPRDGQLGGQFRIAGGFVDLDRANAVGRGLTAHLDHSWSLRNMRFALCTARGRLPAGTISTTARTVNRSRITLATSSARDRTSTRLNSSHYCESRMPSSAY